MKHLGIILLVISWNMAAGQQTCQVKDAELEGKYSGGCKKGLADGKGTATGLYTYTGDFKKGRPNGDGMIKWSADSMYDGEWKKGLRTGKGQLVVREQTVIGYWYQNDYLGKENIRYKVITLNNEISRINFQRYSSEVNRIDIRGEKEQFEVSHPDLLLVISQGSHDRNLRQTPTLKVIENVVYPFQANVSNEFEFLINQPGHWEIIVTMTPKRN